MGNCVTQTETDVIERVGYFTLTIELYKESSCYVVRNVKTGELSMHNFARDKAKEHFDRCVEKGKFVPQ